MADYLHPAPVGLEDELRQQVGLPQEQAPQQEPPPPIDPKKRYQALVTRSRDTHTTDFEPNSTKPGLYFSLQGKVFDRDEIARMDGGGKFLKLQDRNRGAPRGLGEALADVRGSDLAFLPGAENIDYGLDPIPLDVVRKLPDIYTRLRNNDPVTDQERLWVGLDEGIKERQARSDAGGVVGDFARSMPAVGTRFWLEGKLAKLGIKAGLRAAAGAELGAFGEAAGLLADAADVGKMGLEAQAAWKANKAYELYRASRVTKAGNFFARGIARANNEIIDMAAGEAGAARKWWQLAGSDVYKGLEQATVGAVYRGGILGAEETIGKGIGATMAGHDFLDTPEAAEKRAAGASINDERLGKYSEALALGDTFRTFVTLHSGEGLGNIALMPFARAGAAAFKLTPKAVQDFGAFLKKAYPEDMKQRVAGFEKMGEEMGGIDKALKAKNITSVQWWMMKHMADNNVSASEAWTTMKHMGYNSWANQMLLSAEGRYIGGLYGADGGGDYGPRKAWRDMWPRMDEFKGEAIAFALPSIGVLGLSRLGASKYLSGGGSAIRRDIDNVSRYYWDDVAPGGVAIVEGRNGEGAIGVDASAERAATAPDILAHASRNDAINSFYDLTVSEDRPTGELKAFQRVGQAMIRFSKFLVTADPSQFTHPRDQLYHRGIHEELLKWGSKIKKETIDSAILERGREAGREPDPEDITDIEREKVRNDPKVVAEIKERLGEFLDEVKEKHGTPSMTRDKFDAIIKEFGADPKAVAKELAKAEANGYLVRYSLGGDVYGYAVKYGDKSPIQAGMDAVREAAKSVVERLGLPDINVLEQSGDVKGEVKRYTMPIPENPTAEDAHRMGSLVGRELRTDRDVREAIATLKRLRALASSNWYRTKDGAKFAVVKDGGQFRLHPLNNEANQHDKALREKRFGDVRGAEGELGGMGLDPKSIDPEVYLTPRTLNASTSLSRLAWEHNLTTGFSERSWNKYRSAREQLKTEKDEDTRKDLEKQMAESEEEARAAMVNSGELHGGNVRTLRLGEGKDPYYAIELGGTNDDKGIYITAPTKGIGEGHAVEEFLEYARRHYNYADTNGDGLYHRVELNAFSRVAEVARMLATDPDRDQVSRGRLQNIAKMYSMRTSRKLDLDPFSKLVEMIDGWHTNSKLTNGGLWSSGEFDEIRKKMMENPAHLESLAAFYHHAQVSVLGNYGYKKGANEAFMPRGYMSGWVNTKGVHESPMEMLGKMRELGEAAYKKAVEPAKVEPAAEKAPGKTPARDAVKPEVVVGEGDPGLELTPAQQRMAEESMRKVGNLIEGIDYSTVTPEMAGYKDIEAFRKEYEGRPEEMRDATEEEYLRMKYCAGGMDAKAAKSAGEPKKPAGKKRPLDKVE